MTVDGSPPEASSADLVHAIAAGDPASEQLFVLRYLPRIKAMLQARLRNQDRTADLQQDVLIEALVALRRGQLREPDKLSPFVIAIARNVLNSHFRRSVRQPESLEFPDDLPDLKPNTDTLESQRRQQLVAFAMSTLDDIDRAILEMTLQDDLKPGEIARRLNLSSDVVRQRKTRATRRIIELVNPQSQSGASPHSSSGTIR